MSATLHINLSHLTHNYTYLRSKIGANTRFLAVVKAIAYGNDAVSIAKHLENLGVDYFGVAYAEEGIELRKNGITTPILVLHAQPYNYKDIIAYNLEPNLYSVRTTQLFYEIVTALHLKNYPVHLKYNSGLNRLGIALTDIPEIHSILQKGNLKIASILSHLAASEDTTESDFTNRQIERFEHFQNQFSPLLNETPLIHQCNTSGILNYPKAHFSMVRSGIGLYGFGNDSKYDKNLKPIASLTANISQIHELKKGESLGYNRGYICKKPTTIAVITIGHADGLDRIYGNGKGYVIINRQKARILGVVCMDMLMVDATALNCKEGDTVILFDQNFTANDLAEAVGTISYELITGIGPRVKRIIT